jgi:hypothetical protein
LISPHGRTFSYFMTFETNGSFRRSCCRWTGCSIFIIIRLHYV